MSGLSIGMLSGLVVAAVGVAAVSLSTPLPSREGEIAVEEAAVTQPEVVEEAVVEQMPKMEGRQMIMMIGPIKTN